MLGESTPRNGTDTLMEWGHIAVMELDRRESLMDTRIASIRLWHSPAFFVLLYLGAIVLANFSVFWFGKWATVTNAFLFIGLDLTTRDRLHEAWRGRNLVRNMAILIAAGSVLTVALNMAAWRIALASVVAFSCAAMVDTIVYHRTRSINRSNIVSAAVDSLLFPTIAFGGFQPSITIGQWLAKVTGGWLWSLVLHR